MTGKIQHFSLAAVLGLLLLAGLPPDGQAAGGPTDEQVARVGIQVLLGTMTEISGERASLSVKPKLDRQMLRELDRRAEQLARRRLEAEGKKWGQGPVLMCLRENELRGDASKQAQYDCKRKANTSWPELHKSSRSLGARLFYFDSLIDHVKDEKFKTNARHMLAFRLGWQPVWYSHDGTSHFLLVPTPMQDWSRPMIQQALKYAEGDQKTTAELKAALKQAKPFSCVWYAGTLVKEALGGKRFGRVTYDTRLVPQPYIAGSGGRIDCAKARRIKKDKAGMAPVRKVLKKDLIAVESVEGQGWELHTNPLGQPTSKTRIVRIYERVPRRPPKSISLKQYKQKLAGKK